MSPKTTANLSGVEEYINTTIRPIKRMYHVGPQGEPGEMCYGWYEVYENNNPDKDADIYLTALDDFAREKYLHAAEVYLSADEFAEMMDDGWTVAYGGTTRNVREGPQ